MRPGQNDRGCQESTCEGHLLHRARTLADRPAIARDLHHTIQPLKICRLKALPSVMTLTMTWALTRTLRSTATSDDSSQVFDMAFLIVDVDLIVDPER
jgi:hypothetical protein